MNATLIELRNVDFSYDPGRPVLSKCSFTLAADQRLALVGANGCGKTTLLHLIVGLVHPQQGEIEAFGRVRHHEHDFHEVRRRAGLLFQDADDQLFCPTVAEDVAFGPLNLGRSRDDARAIVTQTLDSLGLNDYEHRITYKLSGGEKRLVALATVLAMQPDVLLLDEPTSGLDDEASARLAEILVSLPQAMLVASHDHDFLARVTNGTLRLSDGQVHRAEDNSSPLPRVERGRG